MQEWIQRDSDCQGNCLGEGRAISFNKYVCVETFNYCTLQYIHNYVHVIFFVSTFVPMFDLWHFVVAILLYYQNSERGDDDMAELPIKVGGII